MVAAANGAAPGAGAQARARRAREVRRRRRRPTSSTSPLQGNMWKVLVEQGATVEEGQLICIIEAMKMENEITAHKAGHDRGAPDHRGRRRQERRPARRRSSRAE